MAHSLKKVIAVPGRFHLALIHMYDTCNAGAFGQFATGIGNADADFVTTVPLTMRLLDGERSNYLLAKDLILQIIGEITVAGATYKSKELVGLILECLNMEERMTLCNMVVEAGGKNEIVPPDKTTFKCFEMIRRINLPWHMSRPDQWLRQSYQFVSTGTNKDAEELPKMRNSSSFCKLNKLRFLASFVGAMKWVDEMIHRKPYAITEEFMHKFS